MKLEPRRRNQELEFARWNQLQQRSTIYYNGIGHALRTICRDEGFFGLYKGLGATLLGVGPCIAISFSVYESLRSHWKAQRPDDSTVLVSLTCGSLSGIASSTATFCYKVVPGVGIVFMTYETLKKLLSDTPSF